ncbi:ABC transporter substrate-binding protein [Plantactinospora sp. KLBMP9567]|uniref:ABC transporter substrate-binding protein n=1 Tax=Plantactinospora sp. KLBMP9567 TaxID=3085900 RepID=UPI002982A6D5|nr:extracellular solute-binding protein [Plantactinospora sp. KLBMP9567]MDW5327589.1 extracellular solute-binding protein [Plantactinospora sp. KLBMP9567]
MVDEEGPVDDRLAQELAATLTQARDALPAAAPGAVAAIRRRYRRKRRQRAGLASLAVAVLVLAVTLTGAELTRGVPSVPPVGEGARGTIRVWAITQPGAEPALRKLVNRYNRSAEVDVDLSTFGNEEYKEKLREVGSPEGPDVFASWGGAHLTGLARDGLLADLTPLRDEPRIAGRFLPSALAGGVVDGRQYGIPMSGTHPVVLFYHKGVFADAGVRPPRSYAELLSLVETFKARRITPIALGGAHGWTELMWVMYLAERIGGPGTTADIVAGRPGAWSKPAVVQALREAQALAARGAFGTDFASTGYDDGAASGELASGRAAMQLMGTWEYPTQLARNPDFVADGDLGFVPFPAVSGGAGDPADLVGVPTHYFSMVAGGRYREAALEFVRAVASDDYLDDLVADGEVPPVSDAADRLRGTQHGGFGTSVHELVTRAPSYALAWDQALAPAAATALLDNLRRLFEAELTPEQFAAAMSEAG